MSQPHQTIPEGTRFGRLVVVGDPRRDRWGSYEYLCLCECGREAAVKSRYLRNGLTQSCGCLFRERITTHGQSGTALYMVWRNMIRRCTNQNNPKHSSYGGRGIRVCDRWRTSFQAFAADMGPRPDGASIDRIDNDGHYEPKNFRWATGKEQQNNKRTSRAITAFGETKTVAEWAELVGMNPNTLRSRIEKWNPERAIGTPVEVR